jgi:hypothetical protein
MFAQVVDQEGHTVVIMDEIVDHISDGSAVSGDDLTSPPANGETTHALNYTRLEAMRSLATSGNVSQTKESNPAECADYAVANKFNSTRFCVENLFTSNPQQDYRCREQSLCTQNTQVCVEMPKPNKAALELDEKNGNKTPVL